MRSQLAIALVTLSTALFDAEVGRAAGAPGDAPTVAMLPLVASGLAVDEIAPVEMVVRAAAERHYGPRLLPARQLVERLERGGAKGLRCDRLDPACSAQLGAVCGVAQVLVASMAASGGNSLLSLRLIDVAEVAQLGHASGPVSDVVQPDQVQLVLRALDAPAARHTSVTVLGPAGSLLVIDGEDRGALPMAAPLTDLATGAHDIGLDGPITFRRVVELRRGEPMTVEAPAQLPQSLPAATAHAAAKPEPTAPPQAIPSALVVTGGGVAAVAGAVAVTVGVTPLVLANLASGRLAEREQRARGDPTVIEAEAEQIRADHAAVVGSTAAWQGWGGITTVVGGALVVAGAVVMVAAAAAWPE